MSNSDLILAGDIGGTKTELAIFTLDPAEQKPLVQKTFPSVNYSALEPIVAEFLAETHLKPARACFGVAGPVVAGQATITNLPWIIDAQNLAEAFGFSPAHLINDLVAIANAVPQFQPADLHTINAGQPVHGGAIAVVAPGTGLGEAYLTWDGSHYRAFASEGGHGDFAPTTDLEIEMLKYLRKKFDHVSFERVGSGMGLPNIYDFLKNSGFAPEPDWLGQQLATAIDLTPIIVKAALQPDEPVELALATVKMFVSILGTEAGNMALKVLASGGVYLGGGMPLRLLSLFDQTNFMDAFLRKGRFSQLLAQMPVHIILNPKAAILGAASYIRQ